MSLLQQLASQQNRRDEGPNTELAQQIAAAKDEAALAEVMALLRTSGKAVQSDCIKVVYETARLDPALVAPHAQALISCLDSRNNRLQWGAMQALEAVAGTVPSVLYPALGQLALVADGGSVITRDSFVGILVQLGRVPAYAEDAFTLLHEQLLRCPVNQLPMYAEMTLPVVPHPHKARFIETLTLRLTDLEQESKRKRVRAVVMKAGD